MTSGGKISVDIWIVLVVIAMTLGLWSLLLRMIFTSHALHSTGTATSPHTIQGVRHIQRLLDETTQLLNELKSNNDTGMMGTSKSANMQVLRNEQSLALQIETDLLKIQSELNTAETKLSQCIEQGYGEVKKLEKCNHDLQSAQSRVAQLPESNTMHLSVPSDGASNSIEPWLVVGIPTVARTNNEDYLLKYVEINKSDCHIIITRFIIFRVLASLAVQLPDDPSDLLYHRIVVVLLNIQVHSLTWTLAIIGYNCFDLIS